MDARIRVRQTNLRRTINPVVTVILGCMLVCAGIHPVLAQPVPVFVSTGTMGSGHGADNRSGAVALLQNGKVLVAGGSTGSPASTTGAAVLYDPSRGVFSGTGSLITPRYDAMAAVLQDGRVLISGGYSGGFPGAPTNTTEIYNPATGAFVAGPSMTKTRAQGTATTLPDGSVLVAGGSGTGLNTAELYIPVASSRNRKL